MKQMWLNVSHLQEVSDCCQPLAHVNQNLMMVDGAAVAVADVDSGLSGMLRSEGQKMNDAGGAAASRMRDVAVLVLVAVAQVC